MKNNRLNPKLTTHCFCDAYEIISYKEVPNEYVEQRGSLIKEYEKFSNESVEDTFMNWKYATLEVIQSEIECIKQRRMKDVRETEGNS